MAKENFGEVRKCNVKETGSKVAAWDDDYKFIGNIDIADLKPGMYVRELGGLYEVTDTLCEDDVDYLVPTENMYYSPLCLVKEPEHNKTAREIFNPVYDLITEIAQAKEVTTEMVSKLLKAADEAYNTF